jgi:Carboxypeptidase regulatory-like domain
MRFDANSTRQLLAMTMTLLCGLSMSSSVAQTGDIPVVGTPTGHRVAGTVVSKTDGRPLVNARITLSSVKVAQQFESVITTENGKFEFRDVPAGKYSLRGAKRGFIAAGYDAHEQFSTAIVTGAGLDTETLVLRLAPDALITGKVLDEFGGPVRHASVALYRDEHNQGVEQIRMTRMAQTDDQGTYEVAPLAPGTYFLSAKAKPWYAVHAPARSPNPESEKEAATATTAMAGRSLDVAYPLTYYPDVTEADSATPILVQGGEHVQVDIHLNPVPALTLTFRVPRNGSNGYTYSFPQFEQAAFDGSTLVPVEGSRMISPGVMEVSGIPAGHYNVRLAAGGEQRTMAMDLTKDGEELDTSQAEALTSVKVSVQVPEETTVPQQLGVGLRAQGRTLRAGQMVNAKGEAELPRVAPGKYEVVVWGGTRRYSIAHMSAEGAQVSGHTLTVPKGSSPSVALTLVAGSVEVQGTVTRGGKGFAGAMVVLVPKDPENNRDLFRRDQSDLDGTFTLPSVVPGSYTLLAIDNGWELEWSQPAVITAYSKHGRKIQVGNQTGRTVNVVEAIEVQSR